MNIPTTPTHRRQYADSSRNALVLEGVTIDKKPLKDHLEAVGHRDAFLYVQDLVKDKVSFSESIIKQIHTLVLMDRPEDRGVYRRIPVRIMGAYPVPSDQSSFRNRWRIWSLSFLPTKKCILSSVQRCSI